MNELIANKKKQEILIWSMFSAWEPQIVTRC